MIQSTSGGDNDRDDGDADYSDIKARLDKLQQKLDVRDREVIKPQTDKENVARGKAMGIAFRIATDLVAGVAVGGFLGWLLDSWLGTAPILLIVFLLLGIAAGLRNSVRAARQLQETANPRD
ncbi:MAG: AtpZ/AtpI family protein [Hyphomicrobiales bacterium]|nr:AtpZ/AtpI family protein [Hyphomicrobiales bacterium]